MRWTTSVRTNLRLLKDVVPRIRARRVCAREERAAYIMPCVLYHSAVRRIPSSSSTRGS